MSALVAVFPVITQSDTTGLAETRFIPPPIELVLPVIIKFDKVGSQSYQHLIPL